MDHQQIRASISYDPSTNTNITSINDTEDGPLCSTYCQTANVVFYAILLPLGVTGNLLSVIVVAYIVKHQRTRRSIPDILLGVLASVDLFSVVCVHSISVVALAQLRWTFPKEVCIYQGFAGSTYLKLEFLVQIAISLDRYLALVKPFKYHRASSLKIVRGVVIAVISISIGATILMVATADQDPVPMDTWPMCVYTWNTHSTIHLVILVATAVMFFAGLCVFIYCNCSLVLILWRYQKQKTKSVLAKLTNAVKALNNTDLKNIKLDSKASDIRLDIKTPEIRINLPSPVKHPDENNEPKAHNVTPEIGSPTTPKIVLHGVVEDNINPLETMVVLNAHKGTCQTELCTQTNGGDSQQTNGGDSQQTNGRTPTEPNNVERKSSMTHSQSNPIQLTNPAQITNSTQVATDGPKQDETTQPIPLHVRRHGPKGFGHILKKTMSADVIKSKFFHTVGTWSPNNSLNEGKNIHRPVKKMKSEPLGTCGT